MTKYLRLLSRRFQVEWLLLALALLAVGLVLGGSLMADRLRIAEQEQQRLQTSARIIGDNLANRLMLADRTLATILDDPSYWNGDQRTVAALRSLQELKAVTGLRVLLVADATGRAVNSSQDISLGRDFSRRDYFKRPREQPDPRLLYVLPPFEGVSGIISATVARAIVNARGAFAGVVVATLDPGYSTELLASLLYTPDTRVWLMHGEGRIFQTMPARPELVGTDIGIPGSFFSRHRDSGHMVSVLTGASATTGEQRMIVLRTIWAAGEVPMDQPLVVSISRDSAAVFAQWRNEAWTVFGVFMLFVLATIYGLGSNQSRQRRFDVAVAAHAARQRETAERFKLATRAARIGLWEQDLVSNRLVNLNGIMADLYGLDRTAPLNDATWQACVLPEDWSGAKAALQAAIRNGSQYETSLRIRCGDGEIRVVRVVGQVSYDESGRPEKIVGIYQDITAEWQSEAKVQSRKLEAVGTLAAGIAHDFNNILGSIVGFAEMTADDLPDDSSAKRNVAQILSASFRARDLIARMLAFARQSPTQPVAVDVLAQVREALALLGACLRPSVQLAFQSGMDEASAPATVRAEPTQIQQIVMNLCINAADAIDDYGIIRIAIDPAGKIKSAPLEHVDGICLTVADNGRGMTPEVLARAFDPFFTTKAPSKGSGLGLSVVYGIVTGLGGVIEVQSRVDGSDTGTEFRVFLPLEKNKLPTGEIHGAHIAD